LIIDTSAIIACLFDEAEAEQIAGVIGDAEVCRIGAPTLVEASMVAVGRKGAAGSALLAAFLQWRNFDVLSFSDAHWRIAQTAFARYGKGRHKAALNLGDCFTYATAWVAQEPLLCVGDDFPQTDLELVKLT
jgi:ribonuclease VapC